MRRKALLKLFIVALILVVGLAVMQRREPFVAPPAYHDYYVNTLVNTQQTLSIPSLPAGVTQITDIVFFKYNGTVWTPFTSTELGRYVDPGTGGVSYSFINPPAGSPKVLKKPQTARLLNNGQQAKMPASAPNGITINGLGNVSSVTKPNTKRAGSPNLVIRLIFVPSPPCTAGNCPTSPPGAPAPT